MSGTTKIEWAKNSDGSAGATWNPVRGCTKVSPGCANCYAETFAERWRGISGHAYEQGFDLRLVPDKIDEPLRRKKPTTYFVNSMSDLFQDGVPDEYIDRVFAVMALTPQHTYQVLTKRAERMQKYLTHWPDGAGRRHHVRWEAFQTQRRRAGKSGDWSAADVEHQDSDRALAIWPLPNVWLGVSVENQHFADERIPLLLKTPAAVRFISAEPLLGPVDMQLEWLSPFVDVDPSLRRIPRLDWVIVGGESGPGARPFRIAWARQVIEQCKAAGVPVFMKQVGSNSEGDPRPPVRIDPVTGSRTYTVMEVVEIRDRKGGDMTEWPIDLRVREFPRIEAR